MMMIEKLAQYVSIYEWHMGWTCEEIWGEV